MLHSEAAPLRRDALRLPDLAAEIPMQTYTHMRRSPAAWFEDARLLYRHRTRALDDTAASTAASARAFDARVRDLTGSGLRGKRLLIVGTGQTLREFYAFSSLGADVTGIDLDVVPDGFDPAGYYRLWRTNGAMRLAKTLGRQVLGVDRRFARALAGHLDVAALSRGRLLVMDASRMSFPDESFDVVHSVSVFEHLPDPGAVAREIRRVLAPGGVAYVSTHIYTAEGGCHDLRIFSGNRADIPYWAHLRPAHRHTVRESCYMNRWTLAQWEALFDKTFPGVQKSHEPHHPSFDRQLRASLHDLRRQGELQGYSDRELLTVNAIAQWQKPA